jgi:hypothetical protein
MEKMREESDLFAREVALDWEEPGKSNALSKVTYGSQFLFQKGKMRKEV